MVGHVVNGEIRDVNVALTEDGSRSLSVLETFQTLKKLIVLFKEQYSREILFVESVKTC